MRLTCFEFYEGKLLQATAPTLKIAFSMDDIHRESGGAGIFYVGTASDLHDPMINPASVGLLYNSPVSCEYAKEEMIALFEEAVRELEEPSE